MLEAMLVELVSILIETVRFLPLPSLSYWMIIIGSSFVLDHLNWLDPHKLLGLVSSYQF